MVSPLWAPVLHGDAAEGPGAVGDPRAAFQAGGSMRHQATHPRSAQGLPVQLTERQWGAGLPSVT